MTVSSRLVKPQYLKNPVPAGTVIVHPDLEERNVTLVLSMQTRLFVGMVVGATIQTLGFSRGWCFDDDNHAHIVPTLDA